MKPALIVAWAWSVVVLLGVGVIVITTDIGVKALALGAVPLALCCLVDLLLSVRTYAARRAAAISGICLCGLVLLVAMVSFIAPTLLVVPTCVALISACSYRLQ